MANHNIVYRNLASPLGDMIAGALPEGVCFLEWHDRGGVTRILERVAKRYRCALVEGNHPHLDLLEKELRLYFDGALHEFSLPVAVHGTPIERRTWDLLLEIPYGETRSYGDLARRLGNPGASRAVGRANGANYLSIVVPCHRVIETGGGLRGYGGGLWRKKRLLELEAGAAHTR
jgi:AraC family transcriptional regulator of adaptative response/methylated-DNA-[protein]-cysteine methyltransferase